MLWYTREASVAVYVANLPSIWPLLREHIRFLREHTGSYTTRRSKLPEYGSQGYGNLPRSKRQSRVPTFINSGSDDIELAHDMKSGVRAICTFDEQMQETENPFMRREEIAGTDGKGSDKGEVSGRKAKNGIVRMDVQVDTEVEIQSDRWLGSQLELGQSRTVRCKGPEGQAGRW